MTCRGCGGLVGRDCFNPSECEWITRDMEARAAAEHVLREREYAEHLAGMERDHYDAMERDHLEELAEAGYLPGLA